MGDAAPWPVRSRNGSVAELIRAQPEDPARAELWWCRPTGPALVVGSSQRLPADWTAPRGIDVVRRRSGGSAVAIVPDQVLWIEAIVPTSSAQWTPDVGRQMIWWGAAWHRALRSIVPDLARAMSVVTEPRPPTAASAVVCFAGHGRGEVVTAAGRKLVGISQRRTARWARLQSMVHLRWPAESYVELAEVCAIDRAALNSWTAILPSGIDLTALVAALSTAAAE